MFEIFLSSHLACFKSLKEQKQTILKAGATLVQTILNDGKILVCGNGGSAADAQHFVAEVVVRLQQNRPALSAVALTTDTSILTAAANDFSFDDVFARQVDALGRPNDTLIAISTSGNSTNVMNAARNAKEKRIQVVSLTGSDGGRLAPLSDDWVGVCGTETARIQEAHMFILHFWAHMIESTACGKIM